MIDELIERVRGLVGPDREVDARIRCLLLAGEGAYVEKSPFNGEWCVYCPDRPGRARSLMEPQWVGVKYELWEAEYTASLDAAVALVEQVLPGWSWEARKSGFGNGQASIWNPMKQPAPGVTIRTDHPSSASIALILALLSALKAKEARDGR